MYFDNCNFYGQTIRAYDTTDTITEAYLKNVYGQLRLVNECSNINVLGADQSFDDSTNTLRLFDVGDGGANTASYKGTLKYVDSDSVSETFYVYDGYGVTTSQCFVLTITTFSRYNSGGSLAIDKISYPILHKIGATSGGSIGTAFNEVTSGTSPTVTIDTFTQQGYTESSDINDHYFSFVLTATTTTSNADFLFKYELERQG